MRAKTGLKGFGIGLAAGVAFAAAVPLAASDPPQKAKQGQTQQPAHGGRWQEGHGSGHGTQHNEAGHARQGAGPEIGFRGCAFFENGGFAGRRGEIRDGASVEWLGRGWSDRISSAACHPGCRLIGYVDINYGGPRRNFTGAVADLGPGWNDRISALRAVCDDTATHDSH